jgi:methylated-DNA-[protein]-cysteine S-methyltransferase
MKKAYIYHTGIGRIMIAEDGQGITELTLLPEQEVIEEVYADFSNNYPDYKLEETGLIRDAANQLTQYLEGVRTKFTVPLHPEGTVFQKKVWDALMNIPYGETCTYKQIAREIGNEKACRAVGMANHTNPILIIIPCHRVIGADGSLVGYGCGLPLKKKLLELEKGNR